MCNWWSDEVFCEEMFISYFLKESLVWVKVKAITKVFCQVKIIMKESMQLVSNTARCISSLREAYKKHSVSFRNIQNNLFIGKFLCIIKFFFYSTFYIPVYVRGKKNLRCAIIGKDQLFCGWWRITLPCRWFLLTYRPPTTQKWAEKLDWLTAHNAAWALCHLELCQLVHLYRRQVCYGFNFIIRDDVRRVNDVML